MSSNLLGFGSLRLNSLSRKAPNNPKNTMYPNLSKSIRTGRPFWFPAALALVALGLNQAALADTDNTGTGGTISYTDSSGLNPRSSPPYALGYVVHAYTAIGADP